MKEGERYWIKGKEVLANREKGSMQPDKTARPYQLGRAALYL